MKLWGYTYYLGALMGIALAALVTHLGSPIGVAAIGAAVAFCLAWVLERKKPEGA